MRGFPLPVCWGRLRAAGRSPHDVGVVAKPNLVRLPGHRDSAAREILAHLPEPITQDFLDGLKRGDPKAARALAWYGYRQVSIALRERSVDRLAHALLSLGLNVCMRWQEDDPRDVMVGLAVPWITAQQLGARPAKLFSAVADRLPHPQVADLFRMFGARRDITPKSFGWEIVTTPDGPDFRPRRP
jgi:hypothetical protein